MRVFFVLKLTSEYKNVLKCEEHLHNLYFCEDGVKHSLYSLTLKTIAFRVVVEEDDSRFP